MDRELLRAIVLRMDGVLALVGGRSARCAVFFGFSRGGSAGGCGWFLGEDGGCGEE